MSEKIKSALLTAGAVTLFISTAMLIELMLILPAILLLFP